MGWNLRRHDDIFRTLSQDCRPVNPPLQDEYDRNFLSNPDVSNEYSRLLGQFNCDNNNNNQLLQLQQLILQWKPKFVNCLTILENMKKK